MLHGAQQASASSTAGPRPKSTAILQSDQPPRAAAAREGGRGGTGPESLVRGSVVAPCVSCGICGGLLRDATAFTECLHAFCRKCIYDKVAKDNIKCCPKCGIFMGNPLEKLRPDHSLEHIRPLIFPAKRRKVVTMKKRKERVSSESTLPSVVGTTAEESTALIPAASESKAQKVVAEDLTPVGRDALSRIRGRDFDSACGLTEDTGALIVWQAPPILEETAAHNQLDSKQDPDSFRPPATSDIEYQRQGPTAQMTNISFMVGNSSHARPTDQDDENMRGDILTLINESNARIMEMQLENERAAALERTRILEERLQQELENERTVAAERTRLLEKKLQRELEHEREAAIERTRVLDERLQRESEIARLSKKELQDLVQEGAKLLMKAACAKLGNGDEDRDEDDDEERDRQHE
ncbi:E3 ubiquitin protein ligase DRIP2 [Zea mays]|uniref:E3 ubiquitin protein ligase DRIP2 n=1 Tax=Zea mays TaxID=4577 RepID=A0A1D6HTQ0_MAIZE|nr:E3 ubiquitin protein ligase DRIP2 [Zea mays]